MRKLLFFGIGKKQVFLNIQVDSASPVNFLQKNVLYELKLPDPYLKVNLVEQLIKVFFLQTPRQRN